MAFCYNIVVDLAREAYLMLLKVTFDVCLDCVSSMMFTCVHSLSLCPCLILLL